MSDTTFSSKIMQNLKVLKKIQEAKDICSFELVSPDGKMLPDFSAGAHIDVVLPGGIIRQYSLCGDPQNHNTYKIAVLKDPASRGGSIAMHDSIQEGQTIQTSLPKNHFALNPDAKYSLLFAAGIGITPILSMAEELTLAGADFELHYCARTPSHAAFREQILKSDYAKKTSFYFSQSENSQRIDLAQLLASRVNSGHVYTCGPKRFIDDVLNTARSLGWSIDHLHYELFGADVALTDSDESFEIELASSGRVISVPKDQTVVQALAAAGVEILVSCEQGVCGTCLTGVLKGIPDHKDSYLTPKEQAANNQFTPCCSRSKSARLVIDI